ncbi:MAG: hypothetical protein ABJ263_07040 [Tateyamaria sp.]|uniref:hypothetical protein n=1 Tax=Tateyamaria sp. TaxID=1929288 RepID=UPI003288E484
MTAQYNSTSDSTSIGIQRSLGQANFRLTDKFREEMRGDSQMKELTLIAIGGLERTCWPNPFMACGCTLDGFATSCYFVATCLSAGLCEIDD